jgi:hypothetical protein
MAPTIGPYVPSHLDRLSEAVGTLPRGVVAPALPLDFTVAFSWDLAALVVRCLGTGLYVSGGGYANLTGTANYFTANDRAGIAVTDIASFVEGEHVWAVLNGLTGPAPTVGQYGLKAWLDQGGCLGGIQVQRDAFVLLKDVHANFNEFFGVIAEHGGMSFFDGPQANWNTDVHHFAISAGMAGYFHGSLATQNFETIAKQDVGILLQDQALFFLTAGLSTNNRVGIALVGMGCWVSTMIPTYLQQHNVAVLGNVQNIVVDGCLPIPPPPSVPGG